MTLIAITVCLGYKNNELRYDLQPFHFNGLVDEGEKLHYCRKSSYKEVYPVGIFV